MDQRCAPADDDAGPGSVSRMGGAGCSGCEELAPPLHASPSRLSPPHRSLALPGAMGALGWVAGGFVMAFFFFVTLLSSHMLLRVYEVDGVTHPRWVARVAPASPPLTPQPVLCCILVSTPCCLPPSAAGTTRPWRTCWVRGACAVAGRPGMGGLAGGPAAGARPRAALAALFQPTSWPNLSRCPPARRALQAPTGSAWRRGRSW